MYNFISHLIPKLLYDKVFSNEVLHFSRKMKSIQSVQRFHSFLPAHQTRFMSEDVLLFVMADGGGGT